MDENLRKIKIHESKKTEDSGRLLRATLNSMMIRAYKTCTGKCLKNFSNFEPDLEEKSCLENCYQASFSSNSKKAEIAQEMLLKKLEKKLLN